MNYLPDFDLGVSRHRIEGEGNWWDVTLSFPVPLFFWQPKKGEIAEAEANIQSLQREVEHIQNCITLEIITQAEEVYNMFLFSYQEGEIGSIELIDARRTLVEARKSYADALFSYSIALAALERSIGQSFQGEEQ